MKKLVSIASLAALAATSPLSAQEAEKPEILSPGQIVAQAAPEEWQTIAASDLLIMNLTPDAAGKDRTIIIQLMPPPFSQGWVRNIRKLAKANWWDGTSINRVQDNYVVQWGDPAETEEDRKPLPEGLEVMRESDYTIATDDLLIPVNEHSLTIRQILSKKNLESSPSAQRPAQIEMEKVFADPTSTNEEKYQIIAKASKQFEADPPDPKDFPTDVVATRQPDSPNGWHERDAYTEWVEFVMGWPMAQTETESAKDARFAGQWWPIHCYGALGVGRGLSPDTGSGAELYTVIGHAPRHLDRNIAVVGRIIEGMHHLSSLPRGFGPLGFYETPEERVPIKSIRLASELPTAEQPKFQYLSTEGASFAQYAHRRANREPPFFIKPAGGADICNIPVPVRRLKEAEEG